MRYSYESHILGGHSHSSANLFVHFEVTISVSVPELWLHLGARVIVPISATYLPSQGLCSGSILAVGCYLAIEDLLITLINE